MKKTIKRVIILLFLIFSLFLSIRSSAQKDSLTSKYIYEDVKSGVRQLVANLQGPAKYTYEVYVKQHKIEGIAELFILSAVLLSGCIGFLKIFMGSSILITKDGDPTKRLLPAVLFVIIFISGVISTAVEFTDIMTKISNPEYWAIQDIINNFKH